MQLIINSSDTEEKKHKTLNDVAREVFRILEDGNAVIDVKLMTITPKQFRALHLWFKWCDELFIANKFLYYGALSGKPRRWKLGDFKHGVYKPFILAYKGMHSTKELGTKTPDECLKALAGHIATERGVTLPEWPSL